MYLCVCGSILLQMFELLKPGCNGLLDVLELDSISLETYKVAYEYLLQVHEELVVSRMEEQTDTEPPHFQETQQHGHSHAHRHDSHHGHAYHNPDDDHETDYDYFWPWDADREDSEEFGGFSYLDYDFEDPELMEEGGGRPPQNRRDEL